MSKRESILNVRVPTTLKELIEQFVQKDTHMNESEFFRDACREKIMRDAPDLYKKIFQEEEEKQ